MTLLEMVSVRRRHRRQSKGKHIFQAGRRGLGYRNESLSLIMIVACRATKGFSHQDALGTWSVKNKNGRYAKDRVRLGQIIPQNTRFWEFLGMLSLSSSRFPTITPF